MSQLQHSLNSYIKVVERFVEQKRSFDRVNYFFHKGSIVHFDLYMKGEADPCSFWQVHFDHRNNKKPIVSKEDYKKAARILDVPFDEFMDMFSKM